MRTVSPIIPALMSLFILAPLPGCGEQPRPLESRASGPVDFSGAWELDYSQSDNLQARLNALVRELQRQAGPPGYNQPAAAISIGASGRNSGASIVGLAQMADYITRSQLLEITQGDSDILVKREENFALGCEFRPGQTSTLETPLGRETCGWDGHQLLFRVFLPEGLTIQHRLTLDPAGDRLNIATTLVSDRVSTPFTVNRVYNRYDPTANGIRCRLTLTRGRVCTTESP
jgi:hypothetical protein